MVHNKHLSSLGNFEILFESSTDFINLIMLGTWF